MCGLNTFLPGIKTKEQGRTDITSHFSLTCLGTDNLFIISEFGTIGINWLCLYICLPPFAVQIHNGIKFAEVSKHAEGNSGKVDLECASDLSFLPDLECDLRNLTSGYRCPFLALDIECHGWFCGGGQHYGIHQFLNF